MLSLYKRFGQYKVHTKPHDNVVNKQSTDENVTSLKTVDRWRFSQNLSLEK
jgi:hypothetical protein